MLLKPLGFKCPPGGDRDMCIPPGFSLTKRGIYTTELISDVFIPISKSCSDYWGEQIQFMSYPNNEWKILPPLNLDCLYNSVEFLSFMTKHGVCVTNIFSAIVWCDAFVYHNKWVKE